MKINEAFIQALDFNYKSTICCFVGQTNISMSFNKYKNKKNKKK